MQVIAPNKEQLVDFSLALGGSQDLDDRRGTAVLALSPARRFSVRAMIGRARWWVLDMAARRAEGDSAVARTHGCAHDDSCEPCYGRRKLAGRRHEH